jgi:glutamate-ammonia-ligase adenylyltransferase
MTPDIEPVNADTIRSQLGESYDRFTKAERARHVEMLQSVTNPEDVALHAQLSDDHRWTVTVSTSDCVGALSVISGLLAAYRFNILSAHIYTLDFTPPVPERPTRPRRSHRLHRRADPLWRKLLDILEVRPFGETPPEIWEQFREDLSQLISLLVKGEQPKALDQIIERFSTTLAGIAGYHNQLLPISISLSNNGSTRYTVLEIRSADTPGFLFAFTNALAIIGINIQQADIHTILGQVQDTFWLTEKNGQKIESPQRVYELRVVTALIKQFTYLLPRSPNPGQAMRQFNALTHQLLSRPDWTSTLRNLESTSVMETLADLMGVSQFLWEDFLRMQHENLFPVLIDLPALNEPKPREQLRQSIQEQLSRVRERPDKTRELNRFKDREMFRIDLRHITRRIDFQAFSEELSDLAQVVIEATADLSHRELQSHFGAPALANGGPCPWCICALGKFGGRELGYGSDIEMVTVYQEEGATSGTAPVENSRYFGDFVRSCLKILSTRREGIFEIDLRLRPHGNGGPLASTLNGFQAYYSEEGGARQFERLALVKLRPVAGDTQLAQLVTQARDAYVYSGRPLDLDNILHLRQRQATELVAAGQTSAKHSPGGLVDVEYFVQACQVSVGHLDSHVRVSNTLRAIDRLAQGGHLTEGFALKLIDTYGFLRRLIDALRVVRGHAKDLTIPAPESPEFGYLSRRLQYDSDDQLGEAIASHMSFAQSLWGRRIIPFQ